MKRTVFVLGAGASKPFDFPTGQELFEAVVLTLRSENSGFSALRALGFGSDEIESFRLRLGRSGRASVDAFLEHRPEYMKVGKAAMAFVLVGRENPEHLFRSTGDWLGYLYRRLPNPFRELPDRLVSFLTFNYDRSVEHFLFSALSNGFSLGEQACIKALQKIPIIHLHGSLGPLPWQAQSCDDQRHRPYEPVPTTDKLEIASAGIKIVHEDISDGRDQDFQSAKELLTTAEQVYFLGFGYDKTNMQRLNVRYLKPDVCHGTGFGLTTREIGDVESAIHRRIRIMQDYGCLKLLRSEVDWD